MIKNYHVKAIILKRKNIGETDKILTLYTDRFGKISVIVKGIRKIQSKKAPYLEVFCNVNLFLVCGKSLDIVTDVQPIHPFLNVRSNIQKIAYAYRLVEQIDRLSAERQQNEYVYYLLLKTLEKLDEKDEVNFQEITEHFTLALLKELGYLSDNQTIAGNELNTYFEQIIERELTSNNLLTKVLLNKEVGFI